MSLGWGSEHINERIIRKEESFRGVTKSLTCLLLIRAVRSTQMQPVREGEFSIFFFVCFFFLCVRGMEEFWLKFFTKMSSK